MKKVSKWMVMVMAFFAMSVFSINTSKAQGSVSLQVFYDELQPYGTWMEYGNYGYVWIPRVDRGFSPYASNGYWINTEYGNTWVSDYSWGWAPFHYGRWFYDDFYGWLWVPDTEWAPAWVAWRGGGGYYGWAPLMPGFGIQASFGYYDRIPHHYWSFVPYRYITYRHVYAHCVPRPQVVNIIHHTTIVTHNYTDNRRRTFFTGPSRNEIEKTNRQRVAVHKINDASRPGRSQVQRGTVSIYKPEIDRSREAKTRAVPSRFVRDDRSGNKEIVESRRRTEAETQGSKRLETLRNSERDLQRGSESKREDVRRDLGLQRRSPQLERENNNSEVFQRLEKGRENAVREEQRKQNESLRTEQLEKPNRITVPQDQQIQRREQIKRQNELQRTPEHQSQKLQQLERQNTNRQPNPNVQRQRSNPSPDINRSSPQSEQIRRSPTGQITNPPARNDAGNRERPVRKRN